jgi:hypothetical protein
VRGLAIRVARAVNRALGRRGRVFADRYHARALTTPRAVRHALVYVLMNPEAPTRRHRARSVLVCSMVHGLANRRPRRTCSTAGRTREDLAGTRGLAAARLDRHRGETEPDTWSPAHGLSSVGVVLAA